QIRQSRGLRVVMLTLLLVFLSSVLLLSSPSLVFSFSRLTFSRLCSPISKRVSALCQLSKAPAMLFPACLQVESGPSRRRASRSRTETPRENIQARVVEPVLPAALPACEALRFDSRSKWPENAGAQR